MALLQRVAEQGRPVVRFTLDGRPVEALEGDTILTAMLTNGDHLRRSEFADSPRAGFCLMGACQDCWVRTEEGDRLRACGTFIAEGMRLVSASEWTAADGEGQP